MTHYLKKISVKFLPNKDKIYKSVLCGKGRVCWGGSLTWLIPVALSRFIFFPKIKYDMVLKEIFLYFPLHLFTFSDKEKVSSQNNAVNSQNFCFTTRRDETFLGTILELTWESIRTGIAKIQRNYLQSIYLQSGSFAQTLININSFFHNAPCHSRGNVVWAWKLFFTWISYSVLEKALVLSSLIVCVALTCPLRLCSWDRSRPPCAASCLAAPPVLRDSVPDPAGPDSLRSDWCWSSSPQWQSPDWAGLSHPPDPAAGLRNKNRDSLFSACFEKIVTNSRQAWTTKNVSEIQERWMLQYGSKLWTSQKQPPPPQKNKTNPVYNIAWCPGTAAVIIKTALCSSHNLLILNIL